MKISPGRRAEFEESADKFFLRCAGEPLAHENVYAWLLGEARAKLREWDQASSDLVPPATSNKDVDCTEQCPKCGATENHRRIAGGVYKRCASCDEAFETKDFLSVPDPLPDLSDLPPRCPKCGSDKCWTAYKGFGPGQKMRKAFYACAACSHDFDISQESAPPASTSLPDLSEEELGVMLEFDGGYYALPLTTTKIIVRAVAMIRRLKEEAARKAKEIDELRLAAANNRDRWFAITVENAKLVKMLRLDLQSANAQAARSLKPRARKRCRRIAKKCKSTLKPSVTPSRRG